MEVDQVHTHLARGALDTPVLISAILAEWSAVTDYRTLRDSLPRRLAHLLRCRCVLLYQYSSETLQFTSGSFDDVSGWSAALLAIAHINPIDVNSNILEARAWQTRRATLSSVESAEAELMAVPLIYRQRAIGVLVACRNREGMSQKSNYPTTGTLSMKPAVSEKAAYWLEADLPAMEAVAGVVAMLLENTRLLERDRRRISELSLLNSIASQLSSAGYEPERIYSIVTQRTREITSVDLCALITSTTPLESIPWIPLPLKDMLFDRFSKQCELHSTPLIIERPGETSIGTPAAAEYWHHLPTNIKTFFAIPLVSYEDTAHTTSLNSIHSSPHRALSEARYTQGVKVPGIVVGAYYKPWKLRREELVLLQVLTNQARAALENIYLLAEVVEARNEARKLLRQVLDDVATMRQMEEEKRRLDRLASLGEMAASVAHEVRNPLASIKTSMQMLKDDLEDVAGAPGQAEYTGQEDEEARVNEDAQESVSIVLKEVERLDAIVRDLLLFAKPRQLHCVVCNLKDLSDHVLQVMQPRCLELGVTIRREYTDVPSAYVDIAQMEQVLFNLYTNAIQAMPEGGGILTISCQVVSMEQETCLPTNHAKEGDIAFGTPIGIYARQQRWLELAVSDTGVGISPAQLKRIFQPFFTTKAHGIGLGLPITRRLIEDHRGHLLVKSLPGSGATFCVRLPIVEEGIREHEFEHSHY